MRFPHRKELSASWLLICALCFIGGVVAPVSIIRLPLFTLSAAAFSLGLLIPLTRYTTPSSLSTKNYKGIDIIIFIIIALAAVLGQIERGGVLDIYYPVVIVLTGLIAYRISLLSLFLPVQLVQILLLALTLRATVWFSYPVYGRDRFHHAATEYIVTTGEIIPESLTYYANFPHAHVFAASEILVTGLPQKVGYFSLGIAIALSTLGVFVLGRAILRSNRGGLLAMLLITVTAYHIKAGGEPFAQAIFTALAPFIFYLAITSNESWRKSLLLLLCGLFAVTVQNIAPLILVGILGLIFISEWLLGVLPIGNTGHRQIPYTVRTTVIAILLTGGIYYYVIAEYFRFQTMRVVWIVESFIGAAGESVTNSSAVTGIPTVSLFDQGLPGLLMWALPVLISGYILIFTSHYVLRDTIRGDIKTEVLQYSILPFSLYAVFSVLFISGSRVASRAIPTIVILISPIAAWSLLRLRDENVQIGRYFAVILLVTVAITGTLTPSVAKAELTDDTFHPYLESDHVASIEFASEYTDSTIAGSYAHGYEWVQTAGKNGEMGDMKTIGLLNKDNESSIEKYITLSSEGSTTLYFEYYKMAFGIKNPTTNKIYSVQDAEIYT